MSEALGISIALLRPLADVLRRIDEDGAAFLAHLGVTDDMAPNAYRPAADVDRELAAIAARRDDASFALTLAEAAVVRPLGLFGHMVWLSGSLGDALERAVKGYAMVTQRTRLSLDVKSDLAVLRSTPLPAAGPRGRILTEFPFASLAMRARDATNDSFRPMAMRFSHAGEDSDAYRAVFRAPVTFGAAYDELVMSTDQLALPLASADPITSAALESTIAKLTEDQPVHAGERTIVERVRAVVGTRLEAEPEVIAKQLGISERTLRRHLELAGASVRAVADSVRRERADEMLARGAAVKDIAFALGFSEPSAFSRAYKRWTGKPPKP